ncbi:6-bladed beta-propeller [Leptospira idonii]|uniref:6-bladed beta-propeller n=1 Tax=Leptospira idonii TaxID=1193500 RepID=A0A4R9LWK6_9LEPT|nr:6-bladed beta-propeller [Leptospira idonii]TGN18664.1 6-bladed beta-propeller [Leptospira idonii]
MRRVIIFLFLILTTRIFSIDFPHFQLGEDAAKEEFKKGITYKNLKQYSAAKERFQKAVSLKKDFHLARLELANNYFLLGEWEQSLEELEILSSLNKNDLLLQNKIEVLRLSIAGGSSSLERTYFKTLDGDGFRGKRFRNPVDIVFDEDGNFYIAGFETSNIVQFNSNGEPISNWKGSFTKKIEKPVALAYHNKKIYVCDFAKDEILIFDLKGKLLSSVGGTGNGKGKFHGPAGISFDSKGSFYVSDSGNNRIQKFSPTGEFEIQFEGMDGNRLKNPAGICVYDQKIYVVDKDNVRVLVFDTDGNVVSKISKDDWKKPRNIRIFENQIHLTDELTGIWSYSMDMGEWKLLPRFRDKKGVYRVLTRPFAVNVDSTGSFYAVDYGRHRVDVFVAKNTLLSNLDLKIEAIDTAEFPNVHIYTRLRNRSGKEVIGADRLAFRVYENDNMTPLFSLAKKEKLNEKMNVAFVYENSEALAKARPILEDGLSPFFKSLTEWDSLSLYRAGKDANLILPKTQSLLEILAKIRDSSKEEKWNFGKASVMALNKLTTNVGPRVLVLLVSGESREQSFLQYSKTRIVEYARSHSIPIFVLSTSPKQSVRRSWLDITEPTNGNYIVLDGEGEERQLYSTLRSYLDYRYILSYKTDTNPDLIDRYIKLVVDVEHRNVKGKDEGGYFVPGEN